MCLNKIKRLSEMKLVHDLSTHVLSSNLGLSLTPHHKMNSNKNYTPLIYTKLSISLVNVKLNTMLEI